MSATHHTALVRCVCWHTTNPRVVASGGDDSTVRVWRLYPHQNIPDASRKSQQQSSEDEKSQEHEHDHDFDPIQTSLQKEDSDSDEEKINDIMGAFDPTFQPLNHLLFMPSSGQVEAIGFSPHFGGGLLCALSSRMFNRKASLDIYQLPDWTWNYTSTARLPYRIRLKNKKQEESLSDTISNPTDDQKDENKEGYNDAKTPSLERFRSETSSRKPVTAMPFFEDGRELDVGDDDFVERPTVIPLPYGARERGLCFTPVPHLVFIALLSCRGKHHQRYCCLMACNIQNGASRPCKKINGLMRRKECVTAICLSSDSASGLNKKQTSQDVELALGTNEGRLFVVKLKHDLSWDNTRNGFITHYSRGYIRDINEIEEERQSRENNAVTLALNDEPVKKTVSKKEKERRKSIEHQRSRSKFSVLTDRERCFREMADEATVMLTFESMKAYLWTRAADIDELDIKDFYLHLRPNNRGCITFSQFVQFVDEDGDFMKAFRFFITTGTSRTDRKRAWLNPGFEGDDVANSGSDEEDWVLEPSDPDDRDDIESTEAVTCCCWTGDNQWIVTGHKHGEIRLWERTTRSENAQPRLTNAYSSNKPKKKNPILKSNYYFLLHGSVHQHKAEITSLSMSGTYLVTCSLDGNVLIWHLDFLLPSMNVYGSSGLIQLLATVRSAHLGEEVTDVALSGISCNPNAMIPNGLYLLSSGADCKIRCRHVMELFRQQLSMRALENQQQKFHSGFSRDSDVNHSDESSEVDGAEYG